MEKELNMLEEANSNIRVSASNSKFFFFKTLFQEICSLQETDNENVVGENKLWGPGVVGYKEFKIELNNLNLKFPFLKCFFSKEV